MHVKKCNQHSTYFIKRELEALFELPAKPVTATKQVTVTYKRHRHVDPKLMLADLALINEPNHEPQAYHRPMLWI